MDESWGGETLVLGWLCGVIGGGVELSALARSVSTLRHRHCRDVISAGTELSAFGARDQCLAQGISAWHKVSARDIVF